VECRLGLATASAVAGWAQGAIAGVAGAPAIGAVAIIAVAIGVAVIGMVVTGTAAIGVITSSSSATSGFPTGGAGALRTDTVTIPTRTITTAMGTATAMETTTAMVAATDMITAGLAVAANQGLPSCSGDLPALAIIVAVLTGSWGPRRGEQFELTSAIMGM
jgi:hypothetical protein